MRVGFLLLADEVRVHEVDATIDVVRGGQGIVPVDPAAPRLDRAVALEMVCEPADVDVPRTVCLDLVAPGDEHLGRVRIEIIAWYRSESGRPPEGSHPLRYAIRLQTPLPGPGRHRVVVSCDEVPLAELAFLVVAAE